MIPGQIALKDNEFIVQALVTDWFADGILYRKAPKVSFYNALEKTIANNLPGLYRITTAEDTFYFIVGMDLKNKKPFVRITNFEEVQ